MAESHGLGSRKTVECLHASSTLVTNGMTAMRNPLPYASLMSALRSRSRCSKGLLRASVSMPSHAPAERRAGRRA